MNLPIKYILIALLTLFLSGCFPTDDEEKQKGSVNAVSLCIEKNERQSEMLSKKLIKDQCISKHEQFKDYVWEKGGGNRARVKVFVDKIDVNVSKLKNNFSDFVITSVKIRGHIRGSDGIEIGYSDWISGLWVEPNSIVETFVSIPIDNENNELINNYCSDLEEKKNCSGWRIKGYRGLEIKLK